MAEERNTISPPWDLRYSALEKNQSLGAVANNVVCERSAIKGGRDKQGLNFLISNMSAG